ncbi:MAG: baseplate J/gp47 family protein [Halodesulfovibrio sp.]
MSQPIRFVETDPAAIEARMISTYEAITGTKLYPGAPERLFVESVAMEHALLRQEQDHAARMNLVQYAEGEFLECLGAFVDTHRLPPEAAGVTLRFAVDPDAGGIVIPAGTRATPDGTLLFATDADAAVPAGISFMDVAATCTVTGTKGNGFTAGQIARLSDPVSGVTGVSNTTTSMAGADAEDDEHLRSRILLAPGRFSSAGPADAYTYWAMTAHRDIIDVAVLSPSPCEIEVYPLVRGGQLPQAAVLELVETILTDKKHRPMGDRVTVAAPVEQPYAISVVWYADDPVTQAQTKEAVTKAVDAFIAWQRAKLGRDVNPSELIYRLRAAGAKRVELASPAFAVVAEHALAVPDGAPVITFGGLESA